MSENQWTIDYSLTKLSAWQLQPWCSIHWWRPQDVFESFWKPDQWKTNRSGSCVQTDLIQLDQTGWKQEAEEKKWRVCHCFVLFILPLFWPRTAHLRHEIPLRLQHMSCLEKISWILLNSTDAAFCCTAEIVSDHDVCANGPQWSLYNNILAWKSAPSPKNTKTNKVRQLCFSKKQSDLKEYFYKSVILVKTFSSPHLFESHSPHPFLRPPKKCNYIFIGKMKVFHLLILVELDSIFAWIWMILVLINFVFIGFEDCAKALEKMTKMQSKCTTTDLFKDHKNSPKIKLQLPHLPVAMPKVIQRAKPILLLFPFSLQQDSVPSCLCSIYVVN